MKSLRLKYLVILVCVVIATSCNNDDQESPIVVNNSVLPGDFLSDKKYTSLTLEIVYVSGFQPTSASLNNLKTFLGERLNKPGGITVTQRSVSSSGHSVLTAEMIREIEKTNRQSVTSGSNLTIYFYFYRW